MNETSVSDRMMQCTIANNYDGLNDLRRLAKANPEVAWQIIWKVLNKEEDPGKDDGALSSWKSR